VGWAAVHLQVLLPDLTTEPIAEEIDEVLMEYLSGSPWPDTYDLIDGLVGFGVYALERGPHAVKAITCLERVIDHLGEMAERRPDGVTWASSSKWLRPEVQEESLPHYYDLGLAHGVPGVIALLGCACAAGVAVQKVRPLLEGAVRWLLAQQETDNAGGFSYRLEPGLPPVPAQLTWRYGDPGVAAALLLAARCVKKPAWELAALAIARRAVDRPMERAGIFDGSLYQGSAGLGHLYNRMYQATGKPWLREAARFWLQHTLDLRRPQGSVNGFAAWGPDPHDGLNWTDDPGFLTGSAGIALALLAAITPIEPAWDRGMLVSIPARGAA
jgi:hypothetical protein